MAIWFTRGLRRRVVTTRYPAALDGWATSLPTPPEFFPRRLTRDLCDRMVEVCPSSALRRVNQKLLLDVGACSACERCISVAGDAARPSKVFELAATKRSQLIKSIAIEGDR
jgi:ferredoxin